MRVHDRLAAFKAGSWFGSRFAAWRKDIAGVTAIEFAMVVTPFLMLLFGIIAVGLYFFTTFTLEHAVEQASRLLRTGQAQTSAMTTDQFKAEVCSRAPGFVDCAGKLRVSVQKFNEWTQITPATTPKCLDAGGNLTTATTYNAPVAGEIALVWVCYEWDLASKIPYLHMGNMGSGARLIQVATTFRVEPYE